MKLERSDTWSKGTKWEGRPAWRVIPHPGERWWLWGPWCYSRLDAIWQFLKCNWKWYSTLK